MLDCSSEGNGGKQAYLVSGVDARPVSGSGVYVPLGRLGEAPTEAPVSGSPAPWADNIANICNGRSNINVRGENYCMRCDGFCSKRVKSDKAIPFCRY